jgi:hypothetical protein
LLHQNYRPLVLCNSPRTTANNCSRNRV